VPFLLTRHAPFPLPTIRADIAVPVIFLLDVFWEKIPQIPPLSPLKKPGTPAALHVPALKWVVPPLTIFERSAEKTGGSVL